MLSESIPRLCLVREVYSGLYVALCVRCARRGVVQRWARTANLGVEAELALPVPRCGAIAALYIEHTQRVSYHLAPVLV